MSKDFSFDVVSDFDIQEMNNALDQTKRELAVRFDFQGTNPQINYEDDKKGLILEADSDLKLNSMIDVLESKMVKRNLSLLILDKDKPAEEASGARVRKNIPFKKGLDSKKAKEVSKIIREANPKIKTSIQGETIRVSASSKDDLQSAMQLLRASEKITVPLQFNNYR